MTESEKKLIREEILSLSKAADVLKHSHDKCKTIPEKEIYSYDELEIIEALTSRFARLSDILIQKVFRLIEKLDQDNPGTVRDRIYMADKKGLVPSADEIIKVRTLRNFIAHEYSTLPIEKIFERAIVLVPVLLESAELSRRYIKDKYGVDIDF